MFASARSAEDLGDRDSILRIVTGVLGLSIVNRKRGLLDNQIAGSLLKIVVGSKTKIVILFVGRTINPLSLVAIERSLFVIASNDILTELGAEFLQKVSSMTHDRKITQDRMAFLEQVMDRQSQNQQQYYSQADHPTHANLPYRQLQTISSGSQ